MENVTIDETVDVGAVFAKDRIKPKWFVWKNRKYLVKETTYVWHDRQGEAQIIRFAVTDGATVFELSLNQKTLEWKLDRTVVE
ncbi:MAG: hypothetical protein ACYC5N_01320 [Endomicrobiales bacterium]